MPAQRLHDGVVDSGSYYHVYNKGVEKRIIFNDSQDYEIFLGYLKDYLSAPLDPEGTKRTFTIRGRTFRGTPHQPKNFLNKIELVAYSLQPNNFHLLLYQKAPGSLERFIRSLCTRYSLYYNKKYHRNGSLFDGPYKSVQIKDTSQLLLLTRFLHRIAHSSYPEYLGKRTSMWVNTKVILSIMELNDYRKYVERYELNQKEKELLEEILLENKVLERRKVESTAANIPSADQIVNLKPLSRIPEIFGISVIFLLLTGMSLRNINISKAKTMVAGAAATQSPVLSVSTQATPSPEPTPSAKPKNMVIVKITDGVESVNIRQNPTTSSAKVGQANNGETFEFVSLSFGWYEVKLADGSTGYLSSMYAFPIEPNNQ